MGLSLLHTHEPPLVSCIMPTRNRRSFVPQAIWYFLRQDYPHKELIVIDDGDDNVADLIPADERIRYTRLDRLLQRNCSFVITNNSYPKNSAAHVGLATGALVLEFAGSLFRRPARRDLQTAGSDWGLGKFSTIAIARPVSFRRSRLLPRTKLVPLLQVATGTLAITGRVH